MLLLFLSLLFFTKRKIRMKLLVAFAALVLAVSAASDPILWLRFKKNHNKTYKSFEEEQLRYGVFKKNLRKIEEHNVKFESGDSSYKMGVTKFADLTHEEFVKMQTFKTPNIKYTKVFKSDPNFVAPDSVDWRDKGAVLEVKDQGHCGSCWAFSSTGSLEGQNIIKNNKKISLSEQELVDCSTLYGNHGCNGGVMEYVYDYVQDNGIATESAYPYTASDGTCKQTAKADITISGYTYVDPTETALRDAVASVGPIAIAINADGIQLYDSGIFDEPSCSKDVDHGVLTVGYGTESNKAYWIVKNSWGADWGESGYFRIVRDKNQQCAIGSWNTYPIVN